MTPEQRSLRGRIGGATSWARTAARDERLGRLHATNPSSIEWHIARVLEDPAFADADDATVRAAAESHRKAYFAKLALKSAKARKKADAA